MAALSTWFSGSVSSVVSRGLGNDPSSPLDVRALGEEERTTNQQQHQHREGRERKREEETCAGRKDIRQPLSTGDIDRIACHPKSLSRMSRSRPSSRRQSNATGKCKRYSFVL